MAVSVLENTCFQDGAVAAGPVVCEPFLLLFGWALVPLSVESELPAALAGSTRHD